MSIRFFTFHSRPLRAAKVVAGDLVEAAVRVESSGMKTKAPWPPTEPTMSPEIQFLADTTNGHIIPSAGTLSWFNSHVETVQHSNVAFGWGQTFGFKTVTLDTSGTYPWIFRVGPNTKTYSVPTGIPELLVGEGMVGVQTVSEPTTEWAFVPFDLVLKSGNINAVVSFQALGELSKFTGKWRVPVSSWSWDSTATEHIARGMELRQFLSVVSSSGLWNPLGQFVIWWTLKVPLV